MRIAYITAGAAGMYCGSCMHDNALIKALQKKGVDCALIPTYTPVKTDDVDVSIKHVFYGGINVYLQQKFPIFRHTPAWIDRLFDNRALLNLVSRFSSSTRGEDLGPLTISVLEGEHGHLVKELGKLVQWLKDDYKPDLVTLTNSMFIGFAPIIKREVGVPVLCALQGEDLFLDALIEPYKEQARELLRARAHDIDGFLAPSRFYQQYMSEYLNTPIDKIHVTPLGINPEGHELSSRTPRDIPFTVGFLARICPEKGIQHAIHAFRQLSDELGRDKVKMEIAGYLGGADKPFFDDLMKQVRNWGLEDRVHYWGEIDRRQKLDFLASIDVFTVPAPYKEPKGLSILEAMASGVPVVQPRHGSYVEMVEKTGGGILVEPENIKALTAGLKHYYENREEGVAMGKAGREVVLRDYNDQVMADETLALYQRFTGQKIPAIAE